MKNRTRMLYGKLIILIICFVIIIRIFALILAKYESETATEAEVDVALYLLKEDYKTMTLNLASILPQENVYTYDFSIGNQDGTTTAEIDLSYDLTIRTTTNLPLTFKLYKNEKYNTAGATNIAANNTAIGPDDDGTIFRTITTATEDLYYRTPKTNSYQLVVYFPENYNTENYQDIIEVIEITVESRQYTS